jgi:2-iminobutanoate/2-iminopropanoate deaminase
VNRRVTVLMGILLAAGFFTAAGKPGPQTARKVFNAPDRPVQAPFSDAVLAGNTLYLSGKIGLDKSGKPPAQVEDEIKLLLDSVKATLAQADMTMDDIVSVQVFSTDLSLFDKFNPIYRSYFGKDVPARAFIGAGSLLRGGHFELQAIAVKR